MTAFLTGSAGRAWLNVGGVIAGSSADPSDATLNSYMGYAANLAATGAFVIPIPKYLLTARFVLFLLCLP